MNAVASEHRLELKLVCGCVLSLGRQERAEKLEVVSVTPAAGCSHHASSLTAGTPVLGFGPYPSWEVDQAMRVNSTPEAGGMMEGEHAFILDGQFCFVVTEGGARPVGPIADASWS